jgi:hypothetical protein
MLTCEMLRYESGAQKLMSLEMGHWECLIHRKTFIEKKGKFEHIKVDIVVSSLDKGRKREIISIIRV